MEACIFCRIINGEIPSHRVYEDANTLAFLTVEPTRPGHTLVIPKLHEPDFHRLSHAEYIQLMESVQLVAKKIEEVLKPKRVGLAVEGWDVPHAHVHVIPMEYPHDLSSKSQLEGTQKKATDEELRQIAEKLL